MDLVVHLHGLEPSNQRLGREHCIVPERRSLWRGELEWFPYMTLRYDACIPWEWSEQRGGKP